MDDIFVCTLVLKKLHEYYSDLMQKLWNNDVQLEAALNSAFDESSIYMEAHGLTNRIMQYSGLED
jgi:hypothetical protein